jgi:hypothetical protein
MLKKTSPGVSVVGQGAGQMATFEPGLELGGARAFQRRICHLQIAETESALLTHVVVPTRGITAHFGH